MGWRRGEAAERARDPRVRTTRRLLGLAALGLLWAVLILFRLVQLQVVQHAFYRELADQQQQRTVKIEAPRGAIVDRLGHPLALSVPSPSVCINPLRVPDRPLAAEILARVLAGVDRRELLEKMERAVDAYRQRGKAAHGSGFLWVKRKILPDEEQRLRALKLEWVEFRPDTQRYYPAGTLASHVVGTVNFEEHGNLGLEQSLDKELAGKAGLVRMLTDVQHRGIESLAASQAQSGMTLTLTIDARVQFIAERELQAACERYHAPRGSVAVMNPNTGEILALASYPMFDANRPPGKGEDPSVRFDQPISLPFEPGSVFKIVTVSAGLDTGVVRPETLINCGAGTFRLAGRVIHEAKHGYGTLTVADVLAKSSNIGAIQIGLKIGEERLLEYIRRFGFGRKTGIPLPAESTGTVRDLKDWGKTSIGSVPMGHEVSTTTLQLAQACSVIANGGVLVQPRLILKRQRPGQKPEPEPVRPPQRVIKPETAITMRQLMEGVVLHGTGKAARLAGYTSGGKTGSAQIFDRATKHYSHFYNGSFVGFAPVTNPAIVIAVTLNGTHLFGGVVAAPVFKVIATETLRLLDVPRDLPDVEPPEEPADTYDLAIADLGTPPEDVTGTAETPQAPAAVVLALGPKAPSFEGKTVRAVLEQALASGVPVDVVGTGIARGQQPPPGAALTAGQKVRVEFR